VDLFNADVYGHLRRVQGLIRTADKAIRRSGRDDALPRIAAMRRLDKVRVPLFTELLARPTSVHPAPDPARDILRRPGNPLLRYAAATDPDPVPTTQESLL
jgi:hypothetical protein